jgi:hypothetical protein
VTTNPADFATLGNPGTTTLFGGRGLGTETMSGARLTVGMWFSEAHYWGVEASGFFLGNSTQRFTTSSLGLPFLGRPIVDVGPLLQNGAANPFAGLESTERVAEPIIPGLNPSGLAGHIDVERKSNFWGYDVNLRRGLVCCDSGYLDFLFGYRQLGLDESLTITEHLATTNGTNMRTVVRDRFETNNRFYGGQVGLAGEYRFGMWSLGFMSKVALGNTQEVSHLSGFTSQAVGFAPPVVLPGGLLVQPGTNMFSQMHNKFSVVPETGLTLGYQIRPWCRFTVGYNFLYWSNTIRPGGLVDRAVNTSILPLSLVGGVPGAAVPARPAPLFNSSDFWAQGLTLGLEFRF